MGDVVQSGRVPLDRLAPYGPKLARILCSVKHAASAKPKALAWLIHHGSYAAVRGPHAAAIQPARNIWERREVDRADSRDTGLSRLAKGRGEIEIANCEI